jgi:hypothetical protein
LTFTAKDADESYEESGLEYNVEENSQDSSNISYAIDVSYLILDDNQLHEIYGDEGIVLEDKSTVSDTGALFVQFGRDLYWPEDLVRQYILNYKFVNDPYEEYLQKYVEE